MNRNFSATGFSLVETVVALGLFAFCILGVLALIPIGMGSARSVAEEGSAAALADAFFGAWLVAPTNVTEFKIPSLFTNPTVPVNRPGSGMVYFRDDGEQSSLDSATLQLNYNIVAQTAPSGFLIDLVFQWPPGQSNAATQVRRFQQFIAR
jgi:type II secretory pathway pseudopilin PulG